MNRTILLETMSGTRFLHGVAQEHLEKLADLARLVEYEDGEVLFSAGDPVDDVYLIVRGEVALEMSESGVEPQQLLTLADGDSVGWSALMFRTHRVATAKAVTRTRAIRFDGKRLLALCEEQPRFGFQIMRATAAALARRLNALQKKFFDVYRLQPGGFICGAVEIGVD